MIYDQLKNACLYAALNEGRIDAALRFLATADFSSLADGSHEVDGDKVFARIMTYQTRRPEEAKPETHDRYIDIQYVLDGEEQLLIGFRDEMETIVEQNPEKDIAFYKGPTQSLQIGRGRFLILFPEDVHAPGICIDKPMTVRKVVMKIKIGE